MRRLKTVRRPPIYPKTPGHLPCSSLTHPLPLPSRRPSVSFGGFGFRDGHFYGCIAMTQAVAEALVRFLCERNLWKPAKVFETNVENLRKRGVISDGLKDSFLKIWEKRNDYHHLNNNVERDRQVLEELAREKASLLAKVENEVFHFTVVEGKLVPEQPKYWDASSGPGSHNVFLSPNPPKDVLGDSP